MTGTYYIIAKADADSAVTESNETNNTLNKSIKIGPDLTVSALTVPTSATAGSTIPITDTTKNNGGGDVTVSTTTKLYLSTDTVVDGSDTLLGSRAVPALIAGTSSKVKTNVIIPAGTSAGNYNIIAVSDADGAVTETNEANNNKSKAIAITAP